jgi:colanic acid/amylovoran biosynthesis glycosyltransferase
MGRGTIIGNYLLSVQVPSHLRSSIIIRDSDLVILSRQRSTLDKAACVFEIGRFMPEAVPTTATQPVVASYCTTFLKPEMLHIYRQVTGLKRYKTFVMTRERLCAEEFPFPDIELIPRARKNFLKRFYLKYMRRLPPVYYRGELQVLIKMLRRRPADVMHIYFGHTGVHLLPFAREWKSPCVVSFHGMDIQPRPQTDGYDAQMAELLQIVPLVLARSKSLLLGLERLGCPKEKLRLNRTGIPLDQFPYRQRPLPQDGAWRFVQACRLIAKKGLLTSIRAFAKFHEKHPNAKFRIAGEGPMKPELEATIAGLGLESAVELSGFLSQPDLAALYAGSHVVLHPSEMPPDQNQEGVPNSMLEAMATGLPVLATTHGGIPEAVTHERTGLLVDERDVEALFRAMCRMTEETDLLQQLGRAASLAVREEFEHRKQIENLEGYYDEARSLFKG